MPDKGRVSWRPAALNDAHQMLDYLGSYSFIAADNAEKELHEKVEMSARRPLLGRTSRFDGMREFSMPNFFKIIVYREIEGGIEIVALLDTRSEQPKKL